MKPAKGETPEPNDAEARRKVNPVITLSRGQLGAARPPGLPRRTGGLGEGGRGDRAAARCAVLRGSGWLVLPHRFDRGAAGRRPRPLGGGRPQRALFLRQDTRAPRHASFDRRPTLVMPAMLRPMATITQDTLDWYGFDEYGGSVHDVIGTRCDPYTHKLLSGHDCHHCCHSNLTRACPIV